MTLLGAVAAIAVVAFALGAPVASLLPLAIVLVCPLMMFVMMAGMAGMHRSRDEDPRHRSERQCRLRSGRRPSGRGAAVSS